MKNYTGLIIVAVVLWLVWAKYGSASKTWMPEYGGGH